jgi:hypothetical protein
MKKSLQQLLVKAFKVLPSPSRSIGMNIIFVLMIFCGSAQSVLAQNPSNYITAGTHIGGYHIKCSGQSTGFLFAHPSFGVAPYTFLWNTGETTAEIKDKPAGVYIVTMTDSLNTLHIDTFELRQPYALGYQSTLSDFYGFNL